MCCVSESLGLIAAATASPALADGTGAPASDPADDSTRNTMQMLTGEHDESALCPAGTIVKPSLKEAAEYILALP